MGISEIVRQHENPPIKRMKRTSKYQIRALAGFFAIIIAQAPPCHSAPGHITTIAGDGFSGSPAFGTLAAGTSLERPEYIAVDPDGNVYIKDESNRVFYVEKATGIISHFAGDPDATTLGDGGPATEAELVDPAGIALDQRGNLYIADRYSLIRRVDADTGIIRIVAGKGSTGFSGDGGPATQAQLRNPSTITVDRFNNIYFSDSDDTRIRKVNGVSGYISTVVGTGSKGFSGDGGPATDARVDSIRGMTTDFDGNLYFADAGNGRIRKVDVSTGIITTVAGGSPGAFIENASALDTRFYFPLDVKFDKAGNLFIADPSEFSVRRIDAVTKIATTVTGTGVEGFFGDGGPAIDALNKGVYTLALDDSDNIYMASPNGQRVRMIEAPGLDTQVGPAPVVAAVDRAILLRKLKKLKKKLKKAKKAGRTSKVRKLKKQIKTLKRQM